LPESIQNYTLLSIACLANSEQPEAAKSLIRYLSLPDVIATFRRQGFSAP
jgi:ABC-type molybdate transport system substrate-binding protein